MKYSLLAILILLILGCTGRAHSLPPVMWDLARATAAGTIVGVVIGYTSAVITRDLRPSSIDKF